MFLFYSIEQRTREFRKMFRIGRSIYYGNQESEGVFIFRYIPDKLTNLSVSQLLI